MNALASAWGSRSPRERRILAALGVVAVLALLLTAWVQAERTRARLAGELPALRASIAALEQGAAEAKRLRAMPAATSATASPLASLATDAGGVPGAQVTVIDPRRVRLAGADVGFGALLEWLRHAQSRYGMRVESARLDALPAAGRVRAEIVLTKG